MPSPNLASLAGWTTAPAFAFAGVFLACLVAIVAVILRPALQNKKNGGSRILARVGYLATAWAAVRLVYMVLRGSATLGDIGTNVGLFATVQAFSSFGLLPLTSINLTHADIIRDFPSEHARVRVRHILNFLLVVVVTIAVTGAVYLSVESSTPPYTVGSTAYYLRDTAAWSLLALNALPILSVLRARRRDVPPQVAAVVAVQALLLSVKSAYAITFNLTGNLSGEIAYYGFSMATEIVMVLLLIFQPFDMLAVLHPSSIDAEFAMQQRA
ncbi:hypothetical protein DFJ73DRAFT_925794 [Zopfochytrium polystomum]|nr:hypothetical protein DFJ73DRAFT_925794 [Zopfochytrium polystomum]